MNLLNETLQHISTSMVKTKEAMLQDQLKSGIHPLSLSKSWFEKGSAYSLADKKLALKSLVAHVLLHKLNPDRPDYSCGSVSLLAAAVELRDCESVVNLMRVGANPFLIVQPDHKVPTFRSIIGSAFHNAVFEPEHFLDLTIAFGDKAVPYFGLLNHYKLKKA